MLWVGKRKHMPIMYSKDKYQNIRIYLCVWADLISTLLFGCLLALDVLSSWLLSMYANNYTISRNSSAYNELLELNKITFLRTVLKTWYLMCIWYCRKKLFNTLFGWTLHIRTEIHIVCGSHGEFKLHGIQIKRIRWKNELPTKMPFSPQQITSNTC